MLFQLDETVLCFSNVFNVSNKNRKIQEQISNNMIATHLWTASENNEKAWEKKQTIPQAF